MSKRNKDNLRIKRKYLVWLREARGLSEASVDKAAAAISTYNDWLAGKDFRAFHSERARAFKRHLASQRNERTGAPLSSATICSTLRELKGFFEWLSQQIGYKSRVAYSDAAYLTPDRKSENARRGTLWKPHPSPTQAKHVVTNMTDATVIERRDRALVAFLFLTASREGAAISLQLRHVDLDNNCVHFDARKVNTKFSKSFTTAFFPVGEEFERILQGWVSELRQDHLFSDADPLFPKTKVEIGPSQRFEATGIERAPWSSPSSAAKIFKQAFVDAGLPSYSPHRVRDTIAELAKDHCKNPEDYKAWSQNMGHDDVMTTFNSYGSIAPGRQMEVMERFRGQTLQSKAGDNEVVE